jgi:ketosteroid isomerase-like protein
MPNNIELVAEALRAFSANDIDAVERVVAEDVTYTIRGQSVFSGTHHGRQAMGDVLRRIQEVTGGTMAATPEVMVGDDDALMAYLHVTGSRPDGRTYDNYQAYLYRFRDGKLVEGQTIPVDQQAFAEFLAD